MSAFRKKGAFAAASWISPRLMHFQLVTKVKPSPRAPAFRCDGLKTPEEAGHCPRVSAPPANVGCARCGVRKTRFDANQASALQVVDVDRESRHSYTRP